MFDVKPLLKSRIRVSNKNDNTTIKENYSSCNVKLNLGFTASHFTSSFYSISLKSLPLQSETSVPRLSVGSSARAEPTISTASGRYRHALSISTSAPHLIIFASA